MPLRGNVGAALHGPDRGAQIFGRRPGRSQIIAVGAGTVALGISAAGVAIASPHHDQRRETAPGEFDRLPVHSIWRHGGSRGLIARRAVADQRQRKASAARGPHQHCLKARRFRSRHRNAQILAIKSIGRGGLHRRGDDQHRQQRGAHYRPSIPRRSQRWKFPMISSVSGVGFRVASSSSTDTDCAEATHTPSENTT